MFGDKSGPETRQVVAIDTINVENLIATGLDRYGTRVTIALSLMWGGILNIPSIGDQWLVEKVMGQYVLVARAGFQDERRLLDLNPGDTVFGLRGTTHIFGEEVVIDSKSGISAEGVNLLDPPRVTLSTRQAFEPMEYGHVDFEEISELKSFSSNRTSFSPENSGLYQITVSFFAPGDISLEIGGETRRFLSTSSFTVLERIKSGEEVSVSYFASQPSDHSPDFKTGSMSALWASR